MLINEDEIRKKCNDQAVGLLGVTNDYVEDETNSAFRNNGIGLVVQLIFLVPNARKRYKGSRNLSRILNNQKIPKFAKTKTVLDLIDNSNIEKETKEALKTIYNKRGIYGFSNTKATSTISGVKSLANEISTEKPGRLRKAFNLLPKWVKTPLVKATPAVNALTFGGFVFGSSYCATHLIYNPNEDEAKTAMQDNIKQGIGIDLDCVGTGGDFYVPEYEKTDSYLTQGLSILNEKHNDLLKNQYIFWRAMRAKNRNSTDLDITNFLSKTTEQLDTLQKGEPKIEDRENQIIELKANLDSRREMLHDLKDSKAPQEIIQNYENLLNDEEELLKQQELLVNVYMYGGYANYLSEDTHSATKGLGLRYMSGEEQDISFPDEIEKVVIGLIRNNTDYIFFKNLEENIEEYNNRKTYTNEEKQQEQVSNKTLSQNAQPCHFEENIQPLSGNKNQNFYNA